MGALHVPACKSRPLSEEVLPLELAGCAAVREGGLCERPADGQLRIWVGEHHAATLTVTFDAGSSPRLEGTPVAGGRRFTIAVPSGAKQVIVSARSGTGVQRLRLPIAARHEPPAVVGAAQRLRREGKLADARAALVAALPALSPAERGPANAALGRIAADLGDAGTATRALGDALDAALAQGRLSDAVDDGLALTFVRLVMQDDLVTAGTALDRIARAAAAYAEGAVDLTYFRGLLAQRTGDLRGAMRLFRDAIARAERLGLRDAALGARQELAVALAWIGRGAEAMTLERALIAEAAHEPPCARAAMRMNLAWIALLASGGLGAPAEQGAADPRSLLAEARAAVMGSCEDPFRRRHALLNEGLYALEVSDVALARRRADDLTRLEGGHTALVSVWEAELAARLALAERRPAQARRLFERQQALARAVGFAEGAMRAETGIGRVLVATGRRREAIARFQSAEALQRALVAAVPLGEGRDLFAGGRADSARGLVTALVDLELVADAARAARTARSRVLRAAATTERVAALPPAARQQYAASIGAFRSARARLEAAAADDWRLDAAALQAARLSRAREAERAQAALDDALVAIGAGRDPDLALRRPDRDELMLLYFPGDRGWLGFALTAQGARVVPLGADPKALGAGLLAPFDAELARARRVHVLAYGTLEAIDFHALDWRGQPLVERLPVSYGLDARPETEPRPVRRMALLVGDPAGDLPESAREARLVAERLRERYQPKLLVGPSASRSAVFDLLGQAALFHYAGHGRFGGPDGRDSGLALAGDTALTSGDILALARAPHAVVLSACEAGGAGPAPGAIGVAHAFLLAGAEVVVAPSRPVRDDLAAELTAHFYGEGAPGPPLTLSEALRAAQRSVRRRSPEADWSAYRILTP